MNRRRVSLAGFSGLKGTRATSVLVATTVAAALALSGCQVMSPIQTNVSYQPADGVAVTLGDVLVRDLLVVSRAEGEVGTLSGLVVNKGPKPVLITFATVAGGGGSALAEVPAGGQKQLSGLDGTRPVTLANISAAPGDILKMTVSTPAAGSSEVSVPVLLPVGPYAAITPAPGQGTSNL